MWPQLAEQKVISYTFKPELILTDDMLLVSLKMYGQLKSICVGVCVRVSSNVFLKNVTLFASHCFCFLIFFRCVAELLLTCVCVCSHRLRCCCNAMYPFTWNLTLIIINRYDNVIFLNPC